MVIPTPTRCELGGGLSIRLPPLEPIAMGTDQADGLPTPPRTGKRAEDTAAGCRAKAAADLARAAAPGSEHFRWRLEHSAAAWTARADLLDRLAMKFEARLLRKPL